MKTLFFGVAAAALSCAAPAVAAELPAETGAVPLRTAAVGGAYLRLPLGRPTSGTTPRAGLRLAMSGSMRDPRAFAVNRAANLLDLRFGQDPAPSLFIAGRPVSGLEAERLNAGGASKGRLDKIMIGAGIALGAVAAFFLVSSVAD